MGSSEMKKRSKENEPKTPPPPPSSPAPVVTSQAYSPMPPHGYVASSPQPHLYMWGVQHMMMPPYGTPPPPMYPPGGMYGHPSSLPPGSYPYSPYGMAEASGNTEGGGSKQAEVKEKLPIKRSKGSLGSLNMIIGKNDTGKNSCSKRHVTSRYAESASDGSSEGNDADSQNLQILLMDHCVLMEVISQRTRSFPSLPTGVPGPPTNLNIGMDYWSGHGNVSTTVPGVVVAECDELAQRADVLNGENASLRAEINKLKCQYEELLNRFTAVPSQEGINLDKNEQGPGQDVAETTYGSYNNSA
uniref:G-box binding protein multifunctional mosaic region domain-containing protein n=1 Tax=Brassica oleracea var. oleracea TaxID=109376 RepID=A0A0D3DKY5_BRAOL